MGCLHRVLALLLVAAHTLPSCHAAADLAPHGSSSTANAPPCNREAPATALWRPAASPTVAVAVAVAVAVVAAAVAAPAARARGRAVLSHLLEHGSLHYLVSSCQQEAPEITRHSCPHIPAAGRGGFYVLGVAAVTCTYHVPREPCSFNDVHPAYFLPGFAFLTAFTTG